MNRTAIILIAAAVVAGCSQLGIRGDGVIKTEDRSVPEFTRVAITGGYQASWSAGKPALSISADQNLLPLVRTVVSGGTLVIDAQENLAASKDIKVILSSASLADVQLTGGISFTADQISGRDLRVEATGASEINIAGSVTNLEANLTGASGLHAKSLQTQTAVLTLVGAAEAEIAVTDTLKASVTGAGSLTYSGSPKTVEKTIVGAGTIQNRP
ncbi:MAG: DUF2807 domain-containing protein [Verrucomicrobiae bacterium]|nr:DUF2807 domain-containing protein [Verrucomicrobiae bacterium]